MQSSHKQDKAHKDMQAKIAKSRATKEEVKRATEYGLKKYMNVLKELAKR